MASTKLRSVLSLASSRPPADWLLAWVAARVLRGYRRFVSPHKGFSCAYRVVKGGESCSAFAQRTIAEIGFTRSLPLIRARLKSCSERAKLRRLGHFQENGDVSSPEEQTDNGEEKKPAGGIARSSSRRIVPGSTDRRGMGCDGLDCTFFGCEMLNCLPLGCDALDCGAVSCDGLDLAGCGCSALSLSVGLLFS